MVFDSTLVLDFFGERNFAFAFFILVGVFCDKFVLDFPEDILLHFTFLDPRFLSPKKMDLFQTNK